MGCSTDGMQAQSIQSSRKPESGFRLRRPTAEDGAAVHRLIAGCPPLDRNSLYCNLLQCSHFAATCVLAEHVGTAAPGREDPGDLAGFVSGYRRPDHDDVLFIWQVAVAAAARGNGLGRRMVLDILRGPACAGVTMLQTTITSDNAASWALFESVARAMRARCASTPLFDRERHFVGQHDTEMLVSIGPFPVAGHGRS